MQWIVIPDLSTHRLSLSSLIVGLENVPNKTARDEGVQWSVDKKFAHNSRFRFMTFIYNTGQRPPISAECASADLQGRTCCALNALQQSNA
jgi:hypothetical protein